jgi:cytoplasmic iron level regulating protein YaaA (DUF328/UPF0246 family)
MAYLITCSDSKNEPELLNPSILANLSFHPQLGASRAILMGQYLANGNTIDWTKTLPAWELYSGDRSKVYSKVSAGNWIKPCVEIKILSALFGWVKHTDLLPYYNRRMTDRIIFLGQNISVKKFWYKQQVLLPPIFNPHTDIDLLSGDYRKAINGNDAPVAILPPILFTDWGDQKGRWLNSQLTPIVCN